ncbi:MAG: hypothetical protein J1F63_07515 [Oscillospiraceae bacterium]|nr:hypothetical protein [Oscillospiraceae bacterium]
MKRLMSVILIILCSITAFAETEDGSQKDTSDSFVYWQELKNPDIVDGVLTIPCDKGIVRYNGKIAPPRV